MMESIESDHTPTDAGQLLAAIQMQVKSERTVNLTYGAASSVGHVRETNEDFFAIEPPIFAIADGMGGLSRGAEAAELSVNALVEHWQHPKNPIELVRSVNRDLLLCFEHPGVAGTTLLAYRIDYSTLTCINVGDSRCYLYRSERLLQLTRDQSVREALIELGRDEGSVPSPMLHALTSHIGMSDEHLQCQTFSIALQPGDVVLLCTDGVHGQLGQHQIGSALTLDDPQNIAAELIDRANRIGGRDNATALVLRVGEWT